MIISYNFWELSADAWVIPVNCVGVAGAGLAKAAKLKYPNWYTAYRNWCSTGIRGPSNVFTWSEGTTTLLSVPTKIHWKSKTTLPVLLHALDALRETIAGSAYRRVVVPALGCGCGGLSWTAVRPLIKQDLSGLPVVVVPPTNHFELDASGIKDAVIPSEFLPRGWRSRASIPIRFRSNVFEFCPQYVSGQWCLVCSHAPESVFSVR
jgi:hypothetical protein